MRNCKAIADSKCFKERNHIFRHLLESVGFKLCGLVGAAVAQKVRDYNAVTAFGKMSDLMSPKIAGAWKAVKKEYVGLLVRWWYVNMTISPSRG